MKSIYLLLYYFIFQKLPSSYFPLGKFFNFSRTSILSRIISIGSNNKVQSYVYIGSGNNVTIGSHCQINERVKLDNVVISDYVMIAPGVTVLGKMHEFKDISIPMVFQGEKVVSKTIIETNVWIGTNVIVMPGIKIASGTIVAAGAVVTKDTLPNGIYAGVPAKLLKFRDNWDIQQNE